MKRTKVFITALSVALLCGSVNVANAAENSTRAVPELTESKLEESSTLYVDKARTAGNVSAGYMNGYLTEAEDYDLYTVSIPSGYMFQAQLVQPAGEDIDFDLYLFDSDYNAVDGSENVTYVVNGATLAENVGYINTGDTAEEFYVYVNSYIGGSSTEAYTLTYTFTDVYDSFETDEQPWDAAEFIMDGSSESINIRNISSPIDIDWYKVEVPENYDEMQLSISTSSQNAHSITVYENKATDGAYQMAPVALSGGKLDVTTGEVYYIKAYYSGALNAFASTSIENYTLSLSFSEKVEAAPEAGSVSITGYSGGTYVTYQFGRYYRVTGTTLTVKGVVRDTDGKALAGEPVVAGFMNEAWEGSQYEIMYGYGTTDSSGNYSITITLPPTAGFRKYYVDPSTHYFDVCTLLVMTNNGTYASDYIYQFAYTSYGNNT